MADTLKSNLNFADLDFANIKESLKQFLKQQDTLRDYDFDGSVASVLLDTLAYNTQYNGFYLNMVAGEMFLDTASRRENVVSRAKELGYVPRSARCAKAILQLNFNTDSGPIVIDTMEKNFVFTSSYNGKTYNFVTIQEYSTPAAAGSTQIEVYAGTPVKNTYIWLDGDTGYTIPNAGVDTSTLTVKIARGGVSGPQEDYLPPEEINLLTPTSPVYFLEEVDNEQFRIYFGNDVLGKSVQPGDAVIVTYLVSSGIEANGASVFKRATSFDTNTGFDGNVLVVQSAYGASEIESIDSIKLKAPLLYEASNRAVTAKDYKSILLRDYPYISSVNVWGGEDNDPVRLGYVYMSIKPIAGTVNNVLSQAQKDEIVNDLKTKYAVVTIEPVIVDPDYTYLTINSRVKYNPSLASDPSAVQAKAATAILDYGEKYLGDFGEYFRYSVLSSIIDASDVSITNNETDVIMQKRTTIDQSQDSSYNLLFHNSIEPGSISSSLFNYKSDGYISSFNVSGSSAGWTSPITASVIGATGATADVVTTGSNPNKTITALTLTAAGRTKAPWIFASNADGDPSSHAIFYPTISNGKITAVEVVSGGTGYSNTAGHVILQCIAGQGSGFAATCTVSGGVIQPTVTVTNTGDGYAPMPTVTFTGTAPQGTTAPTVKTLVKYNAQIQGVQIFAGGTGYTAAPTVTFGTPGKLASATSALNGAVVDSVTMLDKGYGFNSPPSVTFTGGAGSGALGFAILTNTFTNASIRDSADKDFAYSRNTTLMGSPPNEYFEVTVTRPSHGLVLGQVIPVYNSTDLLMNNSSTSILSGAYTVASVPDPDTFVFRVPSTVIGPDKGQFGVSANAGFVGIWQTIGQVTRPILSTYTIADYLNGQFGLTLFNVSSLVEHVAESKIYFNASPKNQDVVPKLNQILLIDQANVTPVADVT